MDNLQKINKFITVIESLHDVASSNHKIALESIRDGFLVCYEKQLFESIEEKFDFLVDSHVEDKAKAEQIKNAIAGAGDLKSLFLKARKMMQDPVAMDMANQFLNSNIVMEAISGNANSMVLALIAALGLAGNPVVQAPVQVEQPVVQPEQIVAPVETPPEIIPPEPVVEPVAQPVAPIEQPAEEPTQEPTTQPLPESVQRQIRFINQFSMKK